MSAASEKGGQRLWALFTDTPQLSKGQQRRAREDGRKWRQPETKPAERLWDVDNPSRRHRAFAQRGHDHATVYFIFSCCTADQVRRLREAMDRGLSTADWEWPLTHAPTIFRRLNWNDRQEAWRLFSEGGEP